jgi:hypothetical protein
MNYPTPARGLQSDSRVAYFFRSGTIHR